MPLARAFPGAAPARADGIGDQSGQVTPAGLLPDGTVYGVVGPAAQGSGSAAVTVDLRTGRRTVVARGDAVVTPRFVAANERWLLGVTEKPAPPRVGALRCELARDLCAGPPPPRPRYWCHDRSTGRTVDVTASLPRAQPDMFSHDLSVTDTSVVLTANGADGQRHLGMAGCAGTPRPLGFPLLPQGRPVGPGLVMSLQDRFVHGHRVVVQDTRSGLARPVLDGIGPVAVANAYGLAWHDDEGDGTAAPSRPRVRFAPWGAAARTLDVPAAGGTGRLAVATAGERAFLLVDRSRPLGDLALYDPVRNTLSRLGSAQGIQPWTRVWAAGRYVLWDDGSQDAYQWLDLGPQPVPPARTLDDLHVRGRGAVRG
jgi:hypothetical protein